MRRRRLKRATITKPESIVEQASLWANSRDNLSPNILVRNSEDDQIAWFVEIETSEAGKAVVGAAALADICMENEMAKGLQNIKPNLLLIFYKTSVNLELAVKRLTALRPKTTHLRDIDALKEREALLKISELHTNR